MTRIGTLRKGGGEAPAHFAILTRVIKIMEKTHSSQDTFRGGRGVREHFTTVARREN